MVYDFKNKSSQELQSRVIPLRSWRHTWNISSGSQTYGMCQKTKWLLMWLFSPNRLTKGEAAAIQINKCTSPMCRRDTKAPSYKRSLAPFPHYCGPLWNWKKRQVWRKSTENAFIIIKQYIWKATVCINNSSSMRSHLFGLRMKGLN